MKRFKKIKEEKGFTYFYDRQTKKEMVIYTAAYNNLITTKDRKKRKEILQHLAFQEIR